MNRLTCLTALLLIAGCAAPGEDANYDTRDLERRERFQTEPGAGASSDIINRADWPKITYGPADGRTTHTPNYVADVPMGDDAVDVTQPPKVIWRIDEALAGSKAGNWNGENARDAAVAPLQAAGEVAIIPVRAVFEPPWKRVTTP